MSSNFLNWTSLDLGSIKNKILLRIFLSLACCFFLITHRVSLAATTYFCVSDSGVSFQEGKRSGISDRFTMQLDNQTLQIKSPSFTTDDGRTITPEPTFLLVTSEEKEWLQASNAGVVFSLYGDRFVKALAIMSLGQLTTGTCEKF